MGRVSLCQGFRRQLFGSPNEGITAEVDPIEEMSAIVCLAVREVGAPAFLLERGKKNEAISL
jgi:hypothetical protein